MSLMQTDEDIASQSKNEIPVGSNPQFFEYLWCCYSRQKRRSDESTAQPDPDVDKMGEAVTQINSKKKCKPALLQLI